MFSIYLVILGKENLFFKLNSDLGLIEINKFLKTNNMGTDPFIIKFLEENKITQVDICVRKQNNAQMP